MIDDAGSEVRLKRRGVWKRPDTGTIMHYWRSLRPQQWIKNAFVWAGFLFAHAWHDALSGFVLYLGAHFFSRLPH